MALVLGTNCGFVSERPTDNPASPTVIILNEMGEAKWQ